MKIMQDSGLVIKEKDRFKIIYRENFQIDLETLIENYKISIVNGDDFDGISFRRNRIYISMGMRER